MVRKNDDVPALRALNERLAHTLGLSSLELKLVKTDLR